MSRENVEIIRRMSNAFRSRAWIVAAAPLDPEIEMDATRVPIESLAGVYRGLEEVGRFWIEWLDAWGNQEWDEEWIDAGDDECNTGFHQNVPFEKQLVKVPLERLLSYAPQTFAFTGVQHFDKTSEKDPASFDYTWSYTITIQRS